MRLEVPFTVEMTNSSLANMNTVYGRKWTILAKLRDTGIDSDESALEAMRIAEDLQLHLGALECLTREFSDMTVHRIIPDLHLLTGGPMP